MTSRRAFLHAMAGGMVIPLAAEAQQAGKVYRIGIIARPELADTPFGRAFREGLRDLGWIEGQSVRIDWRWAGGETGQLDAVATELVRSGVDVIVIPSTPGTLAAKRATQTIPIVIASMNHPVERGAVASLARPGGNVTGVSSTQATEAAGAKQLQLLTEAAPRVSRVAFLQDPASDLPAEGREARRQAVAADARKLGLDVRWIDVRNAIEIDAALGRLVSSGVNALYVSDTNPLFAQRERICAFARAHRLSAVGRGPEFAEVGCLVSYGPSLVAMWARSAIYVDRILRGGRPADLPVEQPTKFELVINLKTAKALGLTSPQSLLQRADQVIE